jgi:hypothetical protein
MDNDFVKPTRELSGRWVVIGLFAFAIVLTGAMWGYWKLHRGPFLPLERVLADTFPGSSPKVEGGQRKIHKETPRILRITLKVDFDPVADESRAKAFAERVLSVVSANYDVTTYDTSEIHLFWPEPEREIKQWTIELPLRVETGVTRAKSRSR